MGIIRRFITGTAVAALAASLTSCADDGPPPEPAADKLATGLSKLDISSVPFAQASGAAPNKALQRITAGMDPLAPEVTVAGVEINEENDDAATAELKYTWDIEGPKDWSYTSNAEMTRGEEGQWLVSWAPDVVVPELKPGETLAMRSTPGERAQILGAGGEVLVTDRPVIRIGIDKSRIGAGQLADSAAAIANLVGVDAGSYVSLVESAGEAAFVEALTIRDDADRTITDGEIDAIEGARGIEDTMSLAPTREFARPVLGTVGPATAELIEASDGALEAGDVTGLSGLQQIHDEQLSGKPGITVLVQPATEPSGEQVSGEGAEAAPAQPRTLFETQPRPGDPLKTTLNRELQALAEDVLTAEESASAIVAIQPSTGEILTTATGPGSNGLATGMLGQYPPGSTFKVATSLGLIRQGMTPQSTVSCTENVTVDGAQYSNAPTYPQSALGQIPLKQAIEHSCNTAFLAESDTLPQGELADAAAALGIGVETELGFPAFLGNVPTEAEGTAHAASMIGQGQVLVSPLALATMGASVGEGDRVTPKLLASGPGADAGPDSGSESTGGTGGGASASPEEGSAEAATDVKPVTEEEAAMLRDMMRAVVTEGGASMLLDIPGEPVIAKTGTAEFGTETPPRTHAWMVAVQGDLAVAVFVEEGEYGSTSGGPLMEAFLAGAADIVGKP
ncbi:penicillin-binding transpeptidase domain-containing protein [Arthrobacter monumenti]